MSTTQNYRLYKPAGETSKRRPAFRVKSAVVAATEPQAVVTAIPAEGGSATADDAEGEPSPVGARPLAVRRRWLRPFMWAMGAALAVVLLYGGWLAYSIWQFETDIYRPLPPTRTPEPALVAVAPTPTGAPVVVPASTPKAQPAEPTPDLLKNLPEGRTNVLILGTDKRPNDPDHFPRSDTIILVNVDTETHQARLLTLPRDLVVEVPGYGINKLNSGYLFGEYYGEPGGGQALAVETISQLFDVPIDYYVAINFNGFRKLVDTVGGIDVDVPYEIDDYSYPSDDEGDPFGLLHVHFDEGWQHMDGKSALRYARTRHADNDFMRNRRQLQVILATRKAAMSLNLIPTLPRLIRQLGGMVETNIPFEQQIAFAQFGYQIESSNIITSTIGRDMIEPILMDDGSEGLELDWRAARPMLQDFFGTDVARKHLRGQPATKTRTRTPTPTPTRKVAVKTRTPTPKATPHR